MNRNPSVTVRLTRSTLEKLVKIARRIAPRGSPPSKSAAVRALIEKEKL